MRPLISRKKTNTIFFNHDCRDQKSTSFVLLFANFKVICDLKCKKLFALCHMEWKFQIIKQNEEF